MSSLTELCGPVRDYDAVSAINQAEYIAEKGAAFQRADVVGSLERIAVDQGSDQIARQIVNGDFGIAYSVMWEYVAMWREAQWRKAAS